MKKLILSFIFIFLLFPFVFALQQSGGPLVVYVPLGGSNETKWGLGNDYDVDINLKIRAEGDAASYVSFPANIVISPGKYEYISIKVSLPKNESLLGKNINGSMYALLEGKTGQQVVINLQAKKSITIIPYKSQIRQEVNAINPISGFAALSSFGTEVYYIFAIAVVLIAVVIYLKWKRR